jgi:hypothetical protein
MVVSCCSRAAIITSSLSAFRRFANLLCRTGTKTSKRSPRTAKYPKHANEKSEECLSAEWGENKEHELEVKRPTGLLNGADKAVRTPPRKRRCARELRNFGTETLAAARLAMLENEGICGLVPRGSSFLASPCGRPTG